MLPELLSAHTEYHTWKNDRVAKGSAASAPKEAEIREALDEISLGWEVYNPDVNTLIARFALVRWTLETVARRLREIVVLDSGPETEGSRILRSLAGLEDRVLGPLFPPPAMLHSSVSGCVWPRCLRFYYMNMTQNRIIGFTKENVRWILEEVIPEQAAFHYGGSGKLGDIRWIFATYTPELTCADFASSFANLPHLERIWLHRDVEIEGISSRLPFNRDRQGPEIGTNNHKVQLIR